MEACVSVTLSAIVPGADVVLGLVKEVWILYERIKEINGSSAMCEALYQRLDWFAKRLESDRAKLDDNSAIATVIGEYLGTVKKFKDCLVNWIKFAEEHTVRKVWKLKDVPDKIKEFNEAINELHKKLNYAHIVEMEKWKQTDSKWKKQLEDEFVQFGKQVADEHNKTRDHTTEESNKTRKQLGDGFDKLNKQGEDEHGKTRDHVSAEARSLREYIQPKNEDIEELVQNLENASDEKKDKCSSELWNQCNSAKENDPIPGLLALVKYCRSDKRLLAANKLSRLAKTQEHLEVIVAKGGVKLLMELACEGYPNQIMQIEATLGVLHYFSKDDANQVSEQIVQPLLLVLSTSTTPGATMMAAGVLNKLSRDKNGKKEIADHNGISALVNTFCGRSLNSVDQQRKTYAGEALKNLSGIASYQREVAEAIPKLIKLVQNPEGVQRDLTLVILGNLSKNFCAEIVNANGIRLLQKLLNDGYDTKTKRAKQYAVWALELLSSLYEDQLSKDSSGASLGSSSFGLNELLADYRDNRREKYLPRAAADLAYPRYQSVKQIRVNRRRN